MIQTVPLLDARFATVIDVLKSNAETFPHDAATYHRTDAGAWLPTTWLELWDDVRRSAACLRANGLRTGDRLGILARSCRAWQVTELGALLAGASVVGIDPLAGREQIAWVIRHANIRGLVVDRRDRLDGVRTDDVEFVMVLGDARVGDAGVGDAGVGDAGVGDAGVGDAGVGDAGPEGPAYDCDLPGVGPTFRSGAHDDSMPGPSLPMMVIYTSGTTGTPKGIEYSHALIMMACRAMLGAFPDVQHGRFVCWLPLSALFQRMMNMMGIVTRSATYFVEDPRDIMARLVEIRPTVLTSVPRFYEKVHDGMQARIAAAPGPLRWVIRRALAAGAAHASAIRKQERPGWALRTRHGVADRIVLRKLRAAFGGDVKLLISGSAAAPVWLLEFFHSIGLLVCEAYGITENPVPIAANGPGCYRFGSVGRPLAANRVRIADDGEVVVRGPALFRGYVEQPLTREDLTLEGEYRTGDYGRFDADGFLYLTGRKSDIVKTSGGRRIPLARVEAVYGRSRYVDHIVVFGNNRPYLTALVSLNRPAVIAGLERSGMPPSGDEDLSTPRVMELLHQDFIALGHDLAPYERIHAFAILGEPLSVERGELTSTLKLRRAAIEQRHASTLDALYGDQRRAAGAAG